MLEAIIRAKNQEIERLLTCSDSIMRSIGGAAPRLDREILCHPSGRLQVIAEVKKASPLKGLLCDFADPVKLALDYQKNGAAAISVLSDEKFFGGSKDYVASVARAMELPVLRKDFILHEIQLYESLALGARLVLLIASLHDYKSLLHLSEMSLKLGLEPLIEIHDRSEAGLLKDLPVEIVGVNNRNLKTFEVNLEASVKLADHLDSSYIKVSESGIREVEDMKVLEACGYHAALIGEGLVTAQDPGARLALLLNYREVQHDSDQDLRN